jgi:hypothetical protein
MNEAVSLNLQVFALYFSLVAVKEGATFSFPSHNSPDSHMRVCEADVSLSPSCAAPGSNLARLGATSCRRIGRSNYLPSAPRYVGNSGKTILHVLIEIPSGVLRFNESVTTLKKIIQNTNPRYPCVSLCLLDIPLSIFEK